MQLRLALTYAQSFSPARLVTGTMCVCVGPNNGFHISAHFPDSGKASHALQENTNTNRTSHSGHHYQQNTENTSDNGKCEGVTQTSNCKYFDPATVF